MLLLYCNIANAAIVAIHDDAQAPVPMSAYGAAGTIRIVPWAGLRGDLQKLGTPPPVSSDPTAQIPDTRPYAQPTETPAILKAYAAQVRYNLSVQGVSFTPSGGGQITVNSDRESQSLLNNLASHAATLAPTASVDFTQNNMAYTITAQDAINMFNAVMAQVQTVRNIEATCIADQNATTPSMRVYADIDNAFAGAKR
jgi:hypothetical protein